MLYIDLRPSQTCHSKDGGNCIFHWRGRAWLTIWDRVKIPRYSHKLMHRKRVTCELHDSCFCSMMIKHAIPKTAEVAHSVGHLWEEIEWALNYYITRCTGFQSVLEIRELEKWCCRENSTQQKGPSGPLLSSPGEWERNAVMASRVGVNMFQLCSVSNSLSHTTLLNKVRGTFF